MASNLMMAIWQSGDAVSNHDTLMMCFIGLIALAMLIQAVVIGVAAMGALKTQRKLAEVADELRASAVPFLTEARNVFAKSSELIDDVGPAVRKISRNAEVASANVMAASETFKNKAHDFDELTTEIQGRTRTQVRRVDGMVTGALDATSMIGASIHRAILIPVREIGAIMNGVKAGVDSLLGRARKFGVYPGGRSASRDDSEMGS